MARRELEEEKRKIQALVEKMKKDSEEMTSSYAAEKERMEIRMTKIEIEQEMTDLQEFAGIPVAIPIYECVFEPPAFSFRLEIFLNEFLGPPITSTKSITSPTIDLPAECRV